MNEYIVEFKNGDNTRTFAETAQLAAKYAVQFRKDKPIKTRLIKENA